MDAFLVTSWRLGASADHAVDLARYRWALTVLVVVSAVTGLEFIRLTGLLDGNPTYLGLDGYRILEASRAWLTGGDPYTDPQFIYAPMALVLAAPFAAIGDDLGLMGLAVIGIALALIGVAGSVRSVSAFVLASIGLLAFWPFLADLLLVNVTIELSFAMWLIVRGGRMRDGVALGVLAAAVPKLMLVPFLVWALVWRRPAAAGAIGSGAITGLVGLVVLGPDLHAEWLRALTAGAFSLEFGGNHSISVVSPVLGLVTAAAFSLGLVLVLRTRGPVVGLIWALGNGILVSPYAGDYALLPMVVGWPLLLGVTPIVAIGSAGLSMFASVLFYPVVALLLVILLLLPRGIERDGKERIADSRTELPAS